MNDMKLKPDFLFEISWEVCNKVGGINTVIATKARTVCGKYGDRYFTIGPDLGQGADREFEEDPALLKGWRQTLYEKGIRVRVGHWRIVGRPQVILVDFSSLIPRKDDILKFLWESYRVDSISGQWDYIEPVLFGYAAGLVVASYVETFCKSANRVAAHFLQRDGQDRRAFPRVDDRRRRTLSASGVALRGHVVHYARYRTGTQHRRKRNAAL